MHYGHRRIGNEKCKVRYTFSNESGEFNTFFQTNNARFVTLFQANQVSKAGRKIPWTALGGAVQGIRS